MARDGYGDMAVSNAIGSNVFDIDLGLGLPFVISSLIRNFEPVYVLSKEEQVRQIKLVFLRSTTQPAHDAFSTLQRIRTLYRL